MSLLWCNTKESVEQRFIYPGLSQSLAQINNTPHPYSEVRSAHVAIQGDE